MLRTSFILFLVTSLLACQPADSHTKSPQSDQPQTAELSDTQMGRHLQAHMQFLASDLLKGRDTGSDEYRIAAEYVASQFHLLGLQPGGDSGTWFQEVPFSRSQLLPEQLKFKVISPSGEFELEFIKDYLTSANPLSETDYLKAPVVFAGYGIESDRFNHHDYADIDVRNKIVMILRGRPDYFPSEEGAHLASTRTKATTAVARGAIGLINLHSRAMEKTFSFDRYKDYALTPDYDWLDAEGIARWSFPELKGSGYLSAAAGERVFAAAGLDLAAIFDAIDAGENPIPTAMNMEIELSRASESGTITSPNVIGIIPGSDPTLSHEYVLYSAHLDHIGELDHGEDRINNGALDNASGIAVMLETARRLMTGPPPKRSIAFVAVTAEEKGLIGSDYFATNPTMAKTNIVANINLDMPLILYPFADIIAFGAQHSTLATNVEKAAKSNNISLSPDPMPEQALFTRSDHYSFVQQGIPSIYLVPGFASKDPNINGEEMFGLFLQKHYHQPSDAMALPINFEAGALFTRINADIGLDIANSTTRPRWHEGDYFGEVFAQPEQ